MAAIEYPTYGVPRLDIAEALQQYIDSLDNYIATRVLLLTPVNVESAKYSAIVRKTMTARAETLRGDNARYNRVGLKAEDIQYSCVENGLEGPVSIKARKRFQNDFDAEMQIAKKIMFQLLREQEIRVAAKVFNTTTWAGSDLFLDTSTVWSDASADIIGDIQTGLDKVFENTGMEANTLTINRTVWKQMRKNTGILDGMKNVVVTTQAVISGLIADMIGVDQIIVGRGIYDQNPEGESAFSPTQVWSSSFAALSFIPASAALQEPAVGRIFLWAEDSPENVVTESYEEDQTRSTIVRVRQNTDENILDNFSQDCFGIF